MGFNPSTPTISVVAKLTPYGRTAFSTGNNLIATFRLGDSRANYYAKQLLTSGQVPGEAGNIGPNSSVSNSTTQGVRIDSFLILNGKGIFDKPVETLSNVISTEIVANGQTIINGSFITQNLVDRNNYQTDSLVNLYQAFGLSLTPTQDDRLTGKTYAEGGVSDTALNNLVQTKVVILGISNTKYGETFDGKEFKLDLATTSGTFQIYSTFQNKGANLRVEDANIRDTSTLTDKFGSNIALLFSDSIQRPNNNPTLSWATGFGSYKPFSLGKKELYNFQSNPNTGAVVDIPVGIAYLDKGFAVITEPSMVSAFTSSTSTTVTANSVSTKVYRNVTCIASRGEFFSSNNSSFGGGDVPRVTEIGLYDKEGRLVALGTTDRQVEKQINSPLYFSMQIIL